ncbi:unnamed protein product [Effrenium voratum]|nr:unnamed protein product [Effrenium voratum]
MGIKQLGKFLKTNCSSAMNCHTYAGDYKDTTVAIDISPCLYQCMTAMGDTPPGVEPGSERDTSHIAGVFRRTVRLLEAGIKPIFIFDGDAPDMKKSHVLQQREKMRAKSRDQLEEARAAGDEHAVRKHVARLVKTTQRHNDEVMEMLGLMGVPAMQAPGEAECLCATLASAGMAKAAATEDFDALVFGAPRLLRNLHQASASSQLPLVQDICLEKILEGLAFSKQEFVDFCILAGCDYLPTIGKVGIVTAHQLMKKHRSIESILENLDRAKYTVPESWDFASARRCFEPTDLTSLNLDKLKERPVDVIALQALLKDRHSLPADVVNENMRRLMVMKACLPQPRAAPAPPVLDASRGGPPRSGPKPAWRRSARPPATPARGNGENPLRKAFMKATREAAEEASPAKRRRLCATELLRRSFGADLLLPEDTPLADLERLAAEAARSMQADQAAMEGQTVGGVVTARVFPPMAKILTSGQPEEESEGMLALPPSRREVAVPDGLRSRMDLALWHGLGIWQRGKARHLRSRPAARAVETFQKFWEGFDVQPPWEERVLDVAEVPDKGRGWVARTKVSEGQLLMSVPCIAATEVDMEDEEGWEAELALTLLRRLDELGPKADPRLRVDAEQQALWCGYTATFPDPAGAAFWPKDVLCSLRWPATVEQMLAYSEHIEQSANWVSQTADVSFETACWAVSTVISRSFCVDDVRALIPLADIFNHKPQSSVSWAAKEAAHLTERAVSARAWSLSEDGERYEVRTRKFSFAMARSPVPRFWRCTG